MPAVPPSPRPASRIAFVTTDETMLPVVEETLAPSFHTTYLNNAEELAPLHAATPLNAVVLDIDTAWTSTQDGFGLLQELRAKHVELVLFAITRSRSRTYRLKAESAGADEIFVSPVDFQEMRDLLEAALTKRAEELEALRLRGQARSKYSFCELVGASESMRHVYNAIQRVADSSSTVVIRGESGTGKELVARAIVACGPRCDRPFISVNCAALPESLIEAELFGHEKGAFTGAHEARPGHIEAAHGGTLFLDEISALGLSLESKLLRVLEEHTVQRIGARTTKKIDFRLITASNDDLEEMVRAGRFREDLYYRIHVVPIFLPPLREREGDIALLADHFVRFYCAAEKLPLKRLEPEVVEILEEYPWPGNVRELENLMQRLVLMSEGTVIKVKHLPQQILFSSTRKQDSLLVPEGGVDFEKEMERTEAAYLQAALRRANGKKSAAAQLLRINPQKMKYMCRKHQL
jgi:two-component system response regulator PilR (NtrC family)